MLVDRANDKGQCIILIKKQNEKECVSLAGVSLITYLYGPVGEGMLTFNIHTKICIHQCLLLFSSVDPLLQSLHHQGK